MLLKNGNELQQALGIIIDGMAQSEATERHKAIGVKLMNLAIANYEGEINTSQRQAIHSIIEMAAEAEPTAFKC